MLSLRMLEIWFSVFILVTSASYCIRKFLPQIHPVLKSFLITAMLAPLMVLVIIPFINRLNTF